MVCRSLLLLFSLFFLGCAQIASPKNDGRYFTWVDETGQVRQTLLPQSSPAALITAPSTRDKPVAQARLSAANMPLSDDAINRPSGPSGGEALSGVDRLDSGADRLDMQHYPDGVVLESQGNIRSEGDLPFVSWRDADGVVRTTRYRPEPASKDSSAARGSFEPTAAMELWPAVAATAPSASANEAWERLGIDRASNLFDELSAGCCRELGARDTAIELPDNRSVLIEVDAEAPMGHFSDGKSPFRVVLLGTKPGGAQGLRFRSFIDKKVFVPTFLFLDASMNPVRIVTDLAWKVEPERWHRRGFIESALSVNKNERWLLIMTRTEDMHRQFVNETERGLQSVSGHRFGELSLEWLIP